MQIKKKENAWGDGLFGWRGEIECGAVGVNAGQFFQFVLVAEDALQGFIIDSEWQRNGSPFVFFEGLV